MDLTAILEPNDSGTVRMVGYATVDYSSNSETEQTRETTEATLSAAFDAATASTLDPMGDPISDAVDDPLSYYDFLVLEDDEIVFDEEYSRDQNEG